MISKQHSPLRSSNSAFLKIVKFVITLCILSSYVNPAYAIPPPETLAILGGGIVYPGLLLLGALGVLLQYIWIKTKLYLVWRLYLSRIIGGLLVLVFILAGIYLFGLLQPLTNIETLPQWQQSDSKPAFIDLRDRGSYNMIHIIGALNYPDGQGLTDYLKTFPHQKIVLICERGYKSSNMAFIDADKSLLKQAEAEHRIFYFPGGMVGWMNQSVESKAPTSIYLPSTYAKYLLKKHNFTELNLSGDKGLVSPDQFLKEYTQITARQSIPIINSKTPHNDEIIKNLSQLKNTPVYFTDLSQKDFFPVANLFFILLIQSALIFTLRTKELFDSITNQPSSAYKWQNLSISIFIAFLVFLLGPFPLPIPFDLYLYQLTDLPMNIGYLIGVYALFGLIFLIHLEYPNRKRFSLLRHNLSNVFAPVQNLRFLTFPSYKNIGIVIVTMYFLYVYSFSFFLSSIFLISILLSVPLFIDLFLYFYGRSFKNTPRHIKKILERCGYSCNPVANTFIQLNTHNPLALARINLNIGKKSASLGLFTGKILDDGKFNNQLEDTVLKHYSQMIRNLLLFFQQDIELNLDSSDAIISVRLYHNYADTRVINRHVLLTHDQMVSSDPYEKRFTSTLFQEVFTNSTPLMLDVVKQRWNKKGGCLKALHKLGIFIKSNEKTQGQFLAFSKQIYLDHSFEKAVFAANRLIIWIRDKISRLKFQLAIQSIFLDYYTLIAPKSQVRLEHLMQYVRQPLSKHQLKRVINRALNTLCEESAMWQCYSSLLHQYAFQQLQGQAEHSSRDLSEFLSAPCFLPLPVYYELSATPAQIDVKTTNHGSYWQYAFLETETVRRGIRDFQLKEWQLINQLLEKLSKQLMLPISLVYLTKDDLYTLPRNRTRLINLLSYRYEAWQTQNQWYFADAFSLHDVEQLQHNSIVQHETHALRVAGNQQIITGNAVLYQENLIFSTLPKGSILIADNLLPDQIIACQHLNAIILKKGGYLSHTSIIAREKNIPMIAQFQTSEIKNNVKLMIHSGNQVDVLNNTVLEWEFLEAVEPTSDIGNKAQRLALMNQQGFPLPKTIILKHCCVKEIYQLASTHGALWSVYYEELKQLFNLLTRIKSPLIVRSSTNLEDTSHYSYAGIFYSQSNIHTVDEFISAICASWQNLLDRAAIIKEYSGETEIKLNLIVQPYIKGQFGGVLFTKSATQGQMQVEIAPGGAEGVTQGSTELVSLYIDEKGQPFHAIGNSNILNNKEYQALYKHGHELEVVFGKPQDIEWLLVDQQFYIVQSRDMTSLF
ncbi:MAG: PEP/pyruvate-binding domain-containing protein [Legionella sp.]|uniref:PEP/pyruvate-binding domain-containing protein n=1 Tax=Legionella sp. TaxID=459 RepID=UPI0039E6FAD3